MNYRQKLGYTALGAMIMLIGMTINNRTAGGRTAKRHL